jgi:phosphate transport system protein
MSDLVLDQYDLALETVETGEVDLAERVADRDHEVNRLYLDLESDCIDLFALQQPVASDLRFVASSFKILTDLERIGDLATNLADYAGDTGADRFPAVDVQAIGTFAGEMVSDAMAAYESDDVAACREIAARDDELDERCATAGQSIIADLLETDASADDEADAVLDDATRLMLILRDLERVGDHAVNVCARTLYMAEGSDELIY